MSKNINNILLSPIVYTALKDYTHISYFVYFLIEYEQKNNNGNS